MLTAGGCEEDEEVEECELDDVYHHSAEGDLTAQIYRVTDSRNIYTIPAHLQGAEVGVDWEDVDELEGGEDVGGGEEPLGDEGGVPGVPVLAGEGHRVDAQRALVQNLQQAATLNVVIFIICL